MAQWLARLSSTAKVAVCFPGEKNIYKLRNSDVVNFIVKRTNDRRDRRLNFAIFESGVLAMFWLNPWEGKHLIIKFLWATGQLL